MVDLCDGQPHPKSAREYFNYMAAIRRCLAMSFAIPRWLRTQCTKNQVQGQRLPLQIAYSQLNSNWKRCKCAKALISVTDCLIDCLIRLTCVIGSSHSVPGHSILKISQTSDICFLMSVGPKCCGWMIFFTCLQASKYLAFDSSVPLLLGCFLLIVSKYQKYNGSQITSPTYVSLAFCGSFH